MTIADLISELQKLPPKMKAVSRQWQGPKQVIYGPICLERKTLTKLGRKKKEEVLVIS